MKDFLQICCLIESLKWTGRIRRSVLKLQTCDFEQKRPAIIFKNETQVAFPGLTANVRWPIYLPNTTTFWLREKGKCHRYRVPCVNTFVWRSKRFPVKHEISFKSRWRHGRRGGGRRTVGERTQRKVMAKRNVARERREAAGDAGSPAVLKIMRQIKLLSSFVSMDANAVGKAGSRLSMFSVDLSGGRGGRIKSCVVKIKYNISNYSALDICWSQI